MAEVAAAFADSEMDLLMDGGATTGGSPSTIVDLSGQRIGLLRRGVIPFQEILQTLGLDGEDGKDASATHRSR